VKRAFPNADASQIVPLEGGRSNASYRLRLCGLGDVVVRVYVRDPMTSRIESGVLELLRGTVPVPEIIHADLDAKPNPFIIYQYVPGTTFRELKRSRDRRAVAEASFATGRTLAIIGQRQFNGGTPLRADPAVFEGFLANGPDALPQFFSACAASATLQRRIGSATVAKLLTVVGAWAPYTCELMSQPVLVHGDFSPANIVLRNDSNSWQVAAILDWEFACGGSHLFDVGHFLRYESDQLPLLEPHFSSGFLAAGGRLPKDWRRLSRIVDLAGIAGGLTKAQLPAGADSELHALLNATLDECSAP